MPSNYFLGDFVIALILAFNDVFAGLTKNGLMHFTSHLLFPSTLGSFSGFYFPSHLHTKLQSYSPKSLTLADNLQQMWPLISKSIEMELLKPNIFHVTSGGLYKLFPPFRHWAVSCTLRSPADEDKYAGGNPAKSVLLLEYVNKV